VLIKREAGAVNATVPLVIGTKQSIPASGITLIDVVRNMGASAAPAAGNAIRLIDREVLDAQRANWHTLISTGVTEHYIFDGRDPKTFYVYPQAGGTEAIEIVYSAAPADVVPVGALLAIEVISIDDIYANALLDYILYRAYSKDAEYAANTALAVGHYQAFGQSLGLKSKTDMISNPNHNAAPYNPAAIADAR
jgi:hypothetical protein